MVSSFEVRVVCPSISFFFASLGASLGTSRTFLPSFGNFVFKCSGLGVALGELLPILSQSISWFGSLVGERERMSEVRSSEGETGLSSNGGPVEGDIAVSTPQEVRAFHALDEVCSLDGDTLSKIRDRFQFLDKVRVRLPHEKERACHFFPGEVCFYKVAFLSGLRLPVHPFIMELLGCFGIAPGQLMPNSWRIVVSCMGIWLATTDRDMMKVDELVYLYRLKLSKEYRYYELVPWEKRTRIVRDLPSSFRYWKSRFFFVSEDV
ncbi:hypothetical protein SO802_006763 [Lithocarpus litseifolius]|uniref:Transposase (putative) gypsy type domain-containing protein n=1 Tax=Lithocarpus litseifolius TaxID=425828 RepID=A0AAW2DLU3_9ROSI